MAESGSPETAGHSLNFLALQKGFENVKVGKMVSLHHMSLPKQYLEEVPTKKFCPNFREGGSLKKIHTNFLLYQLGGGGGVKPIWDNVPKYAFF